MNSTSTGVDAWGQPVAGTSSTSVDAWNDAWTEALHFIGDPFETLAHANETDDRFALGSVFCGAYRVLGGAPFDSVAVQADLERARERADAPREIGHAEALSHLVRGDFTAAALRWDELSRGCTDLAAVRFAHDVYLHVGDAPRRLRSSQRALDQWKDADRGWAFVASQHAFALEEAGFYEEATRLGLRALDRDPLDLWALHALAHVYESTNNQTAALDMFRSREATWSTQDSLAVHIWWHLALRLIEDRQFDDVLEIHDRLVPVATTPFRLCDLTSMLWRLEDVGVDVGDRWDNLADALAERPERYTSGFLDLHSALVYSRRPDHSEAERFFAGLETAHDDDPSENSTNFRTIVRPLVKAIQTAEVHPAQAVATLDRIENQLHRIGGSIAQRDLISLTRTRLTKRTMETT